MSAAELAALPLDKQYAHLQQHLERWQVRRSLELEVAKQELSQQVAFSL